MAIPLNPVNVIQSLIQQAGKSADAAKPNDLNFAELLKSGIDTTRKTQLESETLSAKALMGKADMTDVVQSVAKAEVMLKTMVTIRDRLLSAYQEMMNVRI